jgi:hypothetical protein
MSRKAIVGLVLLTNVLVSLAQETKHISVEQLQQLRLPDVVLQSAKPVSFDGQKNPNRVPYVEVRGVIGGTIRFELLLPETWNEGFAMGGGGGFVGSIQNGARDSVNRGYATVGTDTGHEWEPGYMGGWALDTVEAQLNFGYLAVARARRR